MKLNPECSTPEALGANSVSARDAKFTDRLDCRSPEAIERRRLERRDRWVKPHQPPVVSVTPPCLPPAPAEPTSPPDFSVRTLELGHWTADGRYFVWNPPRPKFEEQPPRDVRDEWWAQSLKERSK
jgi:hypothetical protein